jgi:hypothetical protein
LAELVVPKEVEDCVPLLVEDAVPDVVELCVPEPVELLVPELLPEVVEEEVEVWFPKETLLVVGSDINTAPSLDSAVEDDPEPCD